MSETGFIDPQFLKANPMEHEGASLSAQMVNVLNLQTNIKGEMSHHSKMSCKMEIKVQLHGARIHNVCN